MTAAWSQARRGVWVRRVQPYDVSLVLVRGRRTAVLVDCGASLAVGRAVRAEFAALGVRPGGLAALVWTHHHLDHVLGAAAFPGVPVWAAEGCDAAAARWLAHGRAELRDLDPAWDGAAELPRPTDRPVGAAGATLDLGGRTVSVEPVGPAHSPADLVVRVPDVDLLVAGDLVEESGPPAYGPDADTAGWAAALRALGATLGPDTLVVPGHGAPVGRSAVITG